MSADPIEVLDEAVEVVRASGREVTGWMMQSNEDGYTAWLYVEDDEAQWPLFEDVETQITALSAAQWVLRKVRGEGDGADDEG
jgi:hypothetical protein